MVIDEWHEQTLIDALRHLSEARSLVNLIDRDLAAFEDSKRERKIQEMLTGAARSIWWTHKELAKLVPRRSDWSVGEDPFRPKRRADLEPPTPPEPPSLKPPERT